MKGEVKQKPSLDRRAPEKLLDGQPAPGYTGELLFQTRFGCN